MDTRNIKKYYQKGCKDTYDRRSIFNMTNILYNYDLVLVDGRFINKIEPETMCRVIINTVPDDNDFWSYTFLINILRMQGVNPKDKTDTKIFSRDGLIFNVQDVDNFDFILFELVSPFT